MTLLDPLSAILTGALAAPVLIVLYFLKLRRRRVRVASTLLWERAVQDLQVNEPFRWLRPSLLLFLQLLALALLALALGRPAVPGGLGASGRVVLLIDRSASMSATDGQGGGTRLGDALRLAGETLDGLSRGTSVAVVTFAGAPEVLLGATTDRAAARRALERIEPTDQPGDLGAALELIGALAAQPANESETPEPLSVVLLSDGGFAEAAYALAGAEVTYQRAGPPEGSETDNLGLTAISASADYNDPALTRLFLRVQNALDREVAAMVVIEGPAGEIARKAVRVPAAAAGSPATQSVTLELDRTLSGLVTARIDRADRLASDNSASIILSPPERPRVALVSPGGASDPSAWVLGDILAEMDLAALDRMSGEAFAALADRGETIAYDLAVFDRVDVPAGVGLSTLSFGAAVPGYALEKGAEGQDRLAAWQRSHPALRGLVLDGVVIARPAHFVPAPDAPPAEELATGTRGPVMILTAEGRHQLLAVAFEPSASNWPLLDISYPLFLVQALEFLTHAGLAPGNTPSVTARPASVEALPGPGEIVLEGPQTLRARVPAAPAGEASVRVNLGVPERAGVYRDAQGEPVLAVNLASPAESALATRDALTIAGKPVASGALGEGLREIWHWFVLAAAAVLTLEWILFARKMSA